LGAPSDPALLREVESIIDLGPWLQGTGITPSEHPSFGGVHDVHTKGSLHFGGADNVADMKRQGLEGRALDVNDNDPMDDQFRGDFRTEEALTFIYFRVLSAAALFKWPLDEMFFNGLGYIKEQGKPDVAPKSPDHRTRDSSAYRYDRSRLLGGRGSDGRRFSYDWSRAAQVLSDARTIRAVPLVGSIRV
jgi:hypothetical protein